MRELADDVENAIEHHPQWKAGVALLGYLESELGNDERAVELFEQVLADQESPIPYESAWAFGSVLENKSETLDKFAINRYERSLALRDVYAEDALRVSPLKYLAELYAKYNRCEEARQLLSEDRQTEPGEGQRRDEDRSAHVMQVHN